jgi:hypothetical protein
MALPTSVWLVIVALHQLLLLPYAYESLKHVCKYAWDQSKWLCWEFLSRCSTLVKWILVLSLTAVFLSYVVKYVTTQAFATVYDNVLKQVDLWFLQVHIWISEHWASVKAVMEAVDDETR